MKKIFIAFLAAVCLGCLCAFAACSGGTEGEPSYYKLTYQQTAGVTYDSEVVNGSMVREGVTVEFTLIFSDDCEGVDGATVYANDVVLEAKDGVYSFVVTEDTVVRVSGVWLPNTYTVTFDTGDATELGYIAYSDKNGETLTELTVTGGDTVSFSVDVSVYYSDSYKVRANTEELSADSDGFYTFTVSSNVTVSLSGLETLSVFVNRSDGGSGTAEDPYLIENPMDLYYMAYLINSSKFLASAYYQAYYKLVNDIDMNGERLYVIADATSAGAIFCGNFDGNNKTISNYYMVDHLVSQDDYSNVYLPYVGLFGYAVATLTSAPEIYDLNLENFSIEISDAKLMGDSFAVGGVVGFGVGANITNCHVSGEIIAAADDQGYFGFMGGIIGYQQSAYSSDDVRFYSVVRSCSADVLLFCTTGHVYTAGGITGYLSSYEQMTPAIILNCYSSSMISGAINAGGIVGYVGQFGSVKNSYFTGIVSAFCSILYNASREDLAKYAYAFAGGIAGYIEHDVIVSDCIADGDVSAQSINGDDFALWGDIYGIAEPAGLATVNAQAALVENCYSGADVVLTKDFFINTLGWSEGDWIFTDGEYPVVNTAEGHNNYTITIVLGEGNTIGGQAQITLEATDIYIPVSYWNLLDGGFEEYLTTDGGLRSYGYYFDSEFTKKVPYGYVPTSDLTLYVGFADYSEVVGVYYIQTGVNGRTVYLQLDADGTVTYRDGAMSRVSVYTYNGEYVILLDTLLGLLAEEPDTEYYYTFKGVVEDGVMYVTDVDFFTEYALIAVKEITDFVYGSYYAQDGVDYAFYSNGTGTAGDLAFTYKLEVSDGGVTVKLYGADGAVIATGVVENGYVTSVDGAALTAYDPFTGVWEKSATSRKQYSFDGKGGWTYEYYGYTDGEKVVIDSASGSYTVNEYGVIILSDSVKAVYTDGFMQIITDGVTEDYFKQSSYAGVWRFATAGESVEIILNGIGNGGYGSATLTYVNSEYAVDYQTDVTEEGELLTIYYGDIVFGLLAYDAATNTLTGEIYSAYYDAIRTNVSFFLYDDFKGVWISDDSVLQLVEFNGFGSYNVKGSAYNLAVSGTVKIDGVTVGSYKLENATMSGSFTYDGVEYSISYNELTGKVDVTYVKDGEQTSATLERYDGWFYLTLTDGETLYSFDGRGSLASGGTMTAAYSGGEAAAYSYFADGDGVKLTKDGSVVGSITVTDTDGLVITLGGEEISLRIVNAFSGSWLVSGAPEGNNGLVIGEIGASLTASGNFLGEDVTFVYNVGSGYLTFEYAGITLYVNAIGSELAVGASVSLLGNFSVCIDSEARDGWQGTYYSADGLGITFDGFGNSAAGNGIATVISEAGYVVATYSYMINSDGIPQLTYGSYDYLFTQNGATEESFNVNGEYYVLYAVDRMYGRSAYDANGNFYEFDGMGGLILTTKDGVSVEYTYIYEGINVTDRHYVLNLYNSETGEKTRIVFVYTGSGSVIEIDVLYYVSVVGSDKITYEFDGMGNVAGSDGLDYTYVLTSSDEDNDVYYVTITDKNGESRDAVIYGADYTMEFLED